MESPVEILRKYWGYQNFRPLQEDIIHSVLKGQDTMALLPTGGGKSLCYQVPAMVNEGLCLVVSPLISLMEDQVAQLIQQKISALSIHSGQSRREIDILLDNCIYGKVKFLYVSPERLKTDLFLARAQKMNINLLAVDEAHCIAKWGYDFRPPYLEIAAFKKSLDQSFPTLALTATATTSVVQEIVENLELDDPRIFQKSFRRDNLVYVVRKTEDKQGKLKEILTKTQGTAIVYTGTRKKTTEIAGWLNKQGIGSGYYHGGLSYRLRGEKQKEWMTDKTRVMVATNAFGMGINKSDVRAIVHFDTPAEPESYYQEAGRAGRDGERSFAVVLYDQADMEDHHYKVEVSHPDPEKLRKYYQALANYFQLAVGSGYMETYPIDIGDFCNQFELPVSEAYHVLKQLDRLGFIQLNEGFLQPSRLHIRVDKKALYEFQIANAVFDPLIKTVLRLYGGELFTGFLKINEEEIARFGNMEKKALIQQLRAIEQQNILIYQAQIEGPNLTWVLPRMDPKELEIDEKWLQMRKESEIHRLKIMTEYLEKEEGCREIVLLKYFGEEAEPCGHCDLCIERKKHINEDLSQAYKDQILMHIAEKPMAVEVLMDLLQPEEKEIFLSLVREMVDKGILEYDKAWRLHKGR